MFRLITTRVVDTIPTLVIVSMVVFALLEISPGDPTLKVLAAGGADGIVDERDLERRRSELGLDSPAWERYGRWIVRVVQLDFGSSYVSKRPVADLIREKLPPSLVLAAVALTVSVALSIPLGMLSAVRANSALDDIIRVLSLLGASLPSFWMALALMWLFAAQLQWLPALGSFSPAGIVLPALVLAIRTSALLVRVTRAAVLESLHTEYVFVARSKGLSSQQVLWRHVLPNAAIPILTVIGLDFGGLIAHATVIEWVFAWPGIGRLGVDAALANDTPVLLGLVLTASIIVLLVNLVTDIAYGVADPRVRAAS